MATRRKPQLLVRLTLFSVLFSQMLAWPLFEAPFLKIPFEGVIDHDEAFLTPDTNILPNALAGNDRNARHAEEILTSDYKRLLGQLPAKRNVESFIGKGDSDNISEDKVTTKRHADAMFTDKKARIGKQKKPRKPLFKKRRRNRVRPPAWWGKSGQGDRGSASQAEPNERDRGQAADPPVGPAKDAPKIPGGMRAGQHLSKSPSPPSATSYTTGGEQSKPAFLDCMLKTFKRVLVEIIESA
ncbi:VIP peptides-like [Rhinolophus ferrumequinum]|uniref:VIP peptides-like n=1 Tax=Rhinolophus ferrumequinum TaxID=59479 RepID=UPI00140FD1A0|nr:VIP peptides-like [Rhinolophus ferrumequinum]